MDTTNIISEKTLWSAKDLQKAGLSRSLSYQLLSRNDLPVIRLGDRKFMLREPFMKWLEQQADGAEA